MSRGAGSPRTGVWTGTQHASAALAEPSRKPRIRTNRTTRGLHTAAANDEDQEQTDIASETSVERDQDPDPDIDEDYYITSQAESDNAPSIDDDASISYLTENETDYDQDSSQPEGSYDSPLDPDFSGFSDYSQED